MDVSSTPAGWYPDPDNPGVIARFWDGVAWTEARRPVPVPETAPGSYTGSFGAALLGALLLPIVGLIMGVVELGRGRAGPGLALLFVGLVSMVIWYQVLATHT